MARYVALAPGSKKVVLPDGRAYDAQAGVDITSSTNANPIVLTVPSDHGVVVGDPLYIADHEVNTAANGLRKASVVTATEITLTDINDVNVAGVGVGGATGTVRIDVIQLNIDDYLGMTGTIKDGDPVVDLGFVPSTDEVITQGAAVAAPGALTGAAPAALTSAASVAAPTKAEFDLLYADVVELHAQATAIVADNVALHAKLTALISELSGDFKALAG